MTPATIAAFTLVATIIWLKTMPRFRMPPALFATAAIPASVLMLLAARARTVLVGVVLMAVVIGAMTAIRRRLIPKAHVPVTVAKGWSRSAIAYVLLLASVAIFFLYYVRFFENFWSIMNQVSFVYDETSTYIWDAVEALVFGNSLADASTAARIRQVPVALDGLTLLGHGYKSNYIDFPLLQAYYDLGLVGGSLYFLVFVIIPLRVTSDLLLSAYRPPTIQLALACYLILFPRFFFAAEPYYYPTVVIVTFFYATAVRYWSRQTPARNHRYVETEGSIGRA
jgi:hypothetical protein